MAAGNRRRFRAQFPRVRIVLDIRLMTMRKRNRAPALISVILVASLGAACALRPTGPRFTFDVTNPMDEAARRAAAGLIGGEDKREKTVALLRKTIRGLVGNDRSLANYERILTKHGAYCYRDAELLHCRYEKAWSYNDPILEFYYFDITASPGSRDEARVRICHVHYYGRTEHEIGEARQRAQPTCL